jgi:hypothetical protein
MVVEPFFCLTIGGLKATVHRVTHPSVKSGSPDSADFATTQLMIHRMWPFTQWLGQLLAYCGRHSVICEGALPNMPQLADFGRYYHDPASNLFSYRAVTAAICQQLPHPFQWIRCWVIAKSTGSGEPVFLYTVDGCATLRTVALRQAIFLAEKRACYL